MLNQMFKDQGFFTDPARSGGGVSCAPVMKRSLSNPWEDKHQRDCIPRSTDSTDHSHKFRGNDCFPVCTLSTSVSSALEFTFKGNYAFKTKTRHERAMVRIRIVKSHK